MASERIEKLLAMQQKAEAQKRKAEQQLKAAKHKISIQRNKERMRRAFSEGPCGVLDAFGINRGKPLRRLHRLPHDGALR